ncbi:hypothetical protein [Endozoicomonas sp. ONNA2]|uniref:hypothetical protein n=1 Tax=Endozoicomonas sp. ONNA2 TaxID=2828741 RepID=UPI0035A1614F
MATLDDHDNWVFSVVQLPDGRLVSGAADQTIKIWDLGKPDRQPCVATLDGHTGWITSVTVLEMGAWLPALMTRP